MGDDAETAFQLVYPSGSVIEVRTITKPVAGTMKVYLDGVEQLSGWSVDTTTGLVTFDAAPATGALVTADLEFDVPARFDVDHMLRRMRRHPLLVGAAEMLVDAARYMVVIVILPGKLQGAGT